MKIVSLVSEATISKGLSRGTFGSKWDMNTAISEYYSENDPPNDGPVVAFLGLPLENLSLSSLYVRHRLTNQLANQSDESFLMDDANSDITDLNDGRDWGKEARETGRQIVRLLMTSALKLKLEKYKDTVLTEKGVKKSLFGVHLCTCSYAQSPKLSTLSSNI